MKKIIITAISAIAVMASVIGCQIYDSQTNANLYHNGQKLQDLTAEYNNACRAFKNDSSDENAYSTIIDTLVGFTEHFWEKTAMGAVKKKVSDDRDNELNEWAKAEKKRTGVKPTKEDESYKVKQAELIDRDLGRVHSVEWCKNKYKADCIDKASLQAVFIARYNDCSNDTPDDEVTYENVVFDWNGAAVDGGEWSLKTIWEKTYKLRWDYNSKK